MIFWQETKNSGRLGLPDVVLVQPVELQVAQVAELLDEQQQRFEVEFRGGVLEQRVDMIAEHAHQPRHHLVVEAEAAAAERVQQNEIDSYGT